MQATVATVAHPPSAGASRPQPAPHYFDEHPRTPSRRQQVELVLPEGHLVRLTTDRATFSPDRIDPGTRVLLAEGPPVSPAASAVLADVGCGYGPIAIALALRAGPTATVWAVDTNERARSLCQENAEAAGVAGQMKVVAPEEVPADLVVDQVWSNPPIRIGKATLHELLAGWLQRLRPSSGSAALVVQKHLGADSLARWLEAEGWPTTRLASRQAYRVLGVAAR